MVIAVFSQQTTLQRQVCCCSQSVLSPVCCVKMVIMGRTGDFTHNLQRPTIINEPE